MSEHVPENWRVVPLGEIANVVSGGTPARDNSDFWGAYIPWVTPTDITKLKGRLLYNTAEGLSSLGLGSSSANRLPPGTILMTSRATVGDARIAGREVCTNQGFKSLVAKSSVNNLFLFYQMQRCREAYKVFGIGSTFIEVNKKDTERFKLLLPTLLAEQKKIARILSTIDSAIEQTEALIGKYEQIKAGMMHDLFTRGLTADGQLRPPRSEAPDLYQQTPIGWIPKEWKIVSLGEMSDITSGVTLSAKTTPDQKLEIPYLRVANVQDGYLDLSEIKTIKVNVSTFNKLLLQAGDVLMNEGGDFDKLGRGTVWQGEIDGCIHQNHVFRVRTNVAFLRSYFLAYWSESGFGKKYFLLSSKQSTNLASINSTQLKAYPIGLPKLKEQEMIEDRIHSVNLRIRSLKTESQKLSLQKSGLMHDLLTGKVPVNVDEGDDSNV